MRTKRWSARLLAVSLTLSLLPAGALAAENGGTGSSTPPAFVWSGQPVPSANADFYFSLPPFAPSDPNDDAQVAYSKLYNLVWFAWLMREEFVLPFADVPQDSWFYPGVCYVYRQGLMSGVSSDRFAPDELVSRGMAWTVLARMNAANPKAEPGMEWYEPGRNWAVEHGVTDGANPLDNVTREQWVSMMWRRAGYPESGADLSVFADSGQVSAYALEAMRWAVSIGIIQGSDGRISPQAPLTRGELASLIVRLVPVPR